MNSTLNNQTMSKSMNGLNTINADEIYTENFQATNLSSTSLSISGTSTFNGNSTFNQPPTMSGSNITGSTIPITSINNYSNIVLKNAGNFYDAGTTTLTNYMYALNNGTTGAIFISNQGYIGYWDGTSNIWTIDGTGLQTIRNITFSPNSPDTNKLTAFPARKLLMGDNAIVLRSGTDFNHYIKYVNYVTGGSGERIDGVWIQGYAGGALCSSSAVYANQIHLKWQYGSITSVAPHTFLGALLPIWASTGYTGCYRIGNNIGTYQNTLSTNNICFGDYCLNGAYNSNPALTRASENICIGHYTGYKFADVAGDNTTSCNRNVIIGNNAVREAFVNTYDNVVIGYQAMKNTPAFTQSVIIGSGALLNSGGQQSSVIIGYNNIANAGGNYGYNTIVGASNLPNFGGNGLTCIGAQNGSTATDNNRGIFIGSQSGQGHLAGGGCFYIGCQTGNDNITGNNMIYIGNYISQNSSAYNNSTFIGHHDTNTGFSGIQGDLEFVVGGNLNYEWQKLTLPNKNYVYCCQYPDATTGFNLSLRTADTVILSVSTTTINLPTINSTYNFSAGARFTFVKDYPNSVTITLNASATQTIVDVDGNDYASITIPPEVYEFRVIVIDKGVGRIWKVDYVRYDYLTIGSSQSISGTKTFTGTINSNGTFNSSGTASFTGATTFTGSTTVQSPLKMTAKYSNNNVVVGSVLWTDYQDQYNSGCTIVGKVNATNFTDANNDTVILGTNNGNALKIGCGQNTLIGNNNMDSAYLTPLTYVFQVASVTSATSFVFTTANANVRAGATLLSIDNGNNILSTIISSYNTSTRTVTTTSAISIKANSYVYLYTEGVLTYTYSNTILRTNITSFTIGAGLLIYNNSVVSFTSATNVYSRTRVNTYNSATGVISFTSTITVQASTSMYFYEPDNLGSDITNNVVNGFDSLYGVCSGTNKNVVIGQQNLSANTTSNTSALAGKYGGNSSVCVGYGAGRTATFLSSKNTFIGCEADVASTANPNEITQSTCIGYGAKCDGSNQLVLGTSTETTIINGKMNINNIYTNGVLLNNGVFNPYGVGPSWSTNQTIPSTNIQAYYFLLPTTNITITLPSITTDMIGVVKIMFKRVGGTVTTVISATAGTGQNILGYNLTTTPQTSTLLPASIYSCTLVCINTTQWAVYA